ncbi:MAG: guanylate kinase [Kiritimatiellae bacterium]|nr:guanylate kinase [Kiritimatiellia bacterium]
MKPLFIVISAPSGAGKTTLCDMLLQSYPEICYSVSCTTREPRLHEEDGIDYYFHPKESFLRMIRENRFLEYAKVHGNYYGTLKEPVYDVLKHRQSMLLDIDVAGAQQVRDYISELPDDDPLKQGFIDIFILPPSLEELRARLEGRSTDSSAIIEKRLKNAEEEMQRASEYRYQLINDDLTLAFNKICDIINYNAETL